MSKFNKQYEFTYVLIVRFPKDRVIIFSLKNNDFHIEDYIFQK